MPISLNQEWYLPDLYDSFSQHVEKYGATLEGEERQQALRQSLAAAWSAMLDTATPGALADKSAYPCVPTRGQPVRNDLYPNAVRIARDVFPDSRVVVITRDPRAVWNSWVHFKRAMRTRPRRFETIKTWMRRKNPEYNPAVFAANWQTQNRQWMDDNPDSFIRYEDLKKDFQGTLRPVLEALRLDICPETLAHIEACEYEISKSRHRQPALYRKGTTDDWKEHLSAMEVDCIEREAHDLMAALGYIE